ncbi:hypothetical protein N7492_007347 [Penicillium capsulatum]|uniref:ABM domain-containing protein n=1 Tax=Penicillium capsulatum TaxID=69766 RepID=A0A9W9I3M7_9EURO|nr:hypothetical protein N7492_007347 [Penicillium capsulatum]KAJ6117187.1 hypothetical protein N7512_006912 [Penicillium capsulatum]
MSGFSLHVNIYIDPSNVDTFFEHFKPVYDKVIAEPECRFFEVYQAPDEPGQLSWVENWAATPQWFMENQITKEYYKGYLAATEPLFVKPREYKLLNRLGAPYYIAKDH